VKADLKETPAAEANGKLPKKPAPPAAPEPKLSLAQRAQREAMAWFWVALAFLLINGTIGQARVIPSGSMENTLLIGDHLIMSRVGYDAGIPFTNMHVSLWRNPKRQQIVIFKPPFAPDQPDYVKRVIGLPGDTVEIHDGSVWINGQRLSENYTLGRTEPYDFRGPYHVPPGEYFVMGDNRSNSYDSRFWGPVPRNDIIGTPVMIYMSLNASSNSWDPGHLRDRFLAYANAVIHPSTVRWNRLFHFF
jgi:signal peptidase I